MSLEDYLPTECVDIIKQYINFPQHSETELVITNSNRHKYIKESDEFSCSDEREAMLSWHHPLTTW